MCENYYEKNKDKKQKNKDYQKQYHENMSDEQNKKYKDYYEKIKIKYQTNQKNII